MLADTTSLLNLRWRTAQLVLASAKGDPHTVRGLRVAMRIEDINPDDVADEIRLLLHQFGHRPPAVLRDEANRLWLKLKELPE